MTLECFAINIKRLEKAYKCVMPAERTEIISRVMKSLTDIEFAQVVDQIIANESRMPALKSFHKYADSFLEESRKKEARLIDRRMAERRVEGRTCQTCDDAGVVSAIDKFNKQAASFSFGCPEVNCEARRVKHPNSLVWFTLDYMERFELVHAEETPYQVWQRVHESDMPKPRLSPEWQNILNKLSKGEYRAEELE